MNRRAFIFSAGAAAGFAVSRALAATKPRWPQGKKWAYSITYDEGVEELLQHVVPLHRKHGIPGHIALVSSQIGIRRNVPGSSYHDMMILSRDQLQSLAKEGWGISCHSMTHAGVTHENAETEVVKARKTLEDATGLPVTIFTVPGSNPGHPPAIKAAARAGYDAIFTIYDRVNTAETDLLWLGRTPLHTEYPGPFYSAFDPFHRIEQARELGGWIVDYCHCPRPGKAIHPAKDCTTEELEARFEAVKRLGGGDVWLAEPNEVVKFLKDDPECQRAREGRTDPRLYVHDAEMLKLYQEKSS
jgi:peptidoglycan/xylan/chitin deacetylase (PgdA/CDA1 family)